MGEDFSARLTPYFLFWIVKGALMGNACDLGGQKNLKICEAKFIGMPVKASVAVVGSECSPSLVVNLHVQARNRSVHWRGSFASTRKVLIPGFTTASAYGKRQAVVKVHLIQPTFENVGMYEVKLLSISGPTGVTARKGLTLARGIIVQEMCVNANDLHESRWWGPMSQESKIFIFSAFSMIALLSSLILFLGCCKESTSWSTEGPFQNQYQLTPYFPDRGDMNGKCIASSVWASQSIGDMSRMTPRARHYCQVDSDLWSPDHAAYDTNMPSDILRQNKHSRRSSIRSGSFFGSEVML